MQDRRQAHFVAQSIKDRLRREFDIELSLEKEEDEPDIAGIRKLPSALVLERAEGELAHRGHLKIGRICFSCVVTATREELRKALQQIAPKMELITAR